MSSSATSPRASLAGVSLADIREELMLRETAELREERDRLQTQSVEIAHRITRINSRLAELAVGVDRHSRSASSVAEPSSRRHAADVMGYIMATVATSYGMSIEELKKPGCHRTLSRARQGLYVPRP